MAVFGAVVVVAAMFIKKWQIHLRDLYDNRGGRHRYLGGIDWAAYLSIIVGGIFYFSTHDSPADRAGPLFNDISAGIPTLFLTAAIYMVPARVPALLGGAGGAPAE